MARRFKWRHTFRERVNFSPTPRFAQVWGNSVRKWLLYADFRGSVGFDDRLSGPLNRSVDVRVYQVYSVILSPDFRRLEALTASRAL